MKELLKKTIDETMDLLNNEPEWRKRYGDYASEISQNLSFIEDVRKDFHEWAPLYVYLNVSSAKNARTSVQFELRYLGQTVAKLKRDKDSTLTLSTKGFEDKNKEYFDCELEISDNWAGKDALKFRRFFKDKKGKHGGGEKHNEEHRVQSSLLTEFSRTIDKKILGIKPVLVGGIRFPMPTPLSASNHKKIRYSRQHGGGIDIMARMGAGGKSTRLCIMELKDENIPSEPPIDVMKQAIAYTTFIHELLRSDSGASWWKIFGFTQHIPVELELCAAAVMPSNESNPHFEDIILDIGKDKIRLGQLYFDDTKERPQFNTKDSCLDQNVRFR